jgi:hypothetical protein
MIVDHHLPTPADYDMGYQQSRRTSGYTLQRRSVGPLPNNLLQVPPLSIQSSDPSLLFRPAACLCRLPPVPEVLVHVALERFLLLPSGQSPPVYAAHLRNLPVGDSVISRQLGSAPSHLAAVCAILQKPFRRPRRQRL